MTSLETEDGIIFNIGGFNRNRLSDKEYAQDKVCDIWPETEFTIISDDDENVINDVNSELGDRLESIVSGKGDSCDLIGVINEDESLLYVSPFVEILEADAATDKVIYIVDDNIAEDSVASVELEGAEGVDDNSVDICSWPIPEEEVDCGNAVRRMEVDCEQAVIGKIESPVHFVKIEPEDSSEDEDGGGCGAGGDIQWTPVRVDENGFVHPVEPQLVKPVFVIDSASDVTVQFDGEFIDAVGEHCEDDSVTPTDEGLAVSDDDVDAIEWLFRMKERLHCNDVDDSTRSQSLAAEDLSAERRRLLESVDANCNSSLLSGRSSVTASIVING